MDNLKEALLSYMGATDKLIACVENEDYDTIDTLLDKRQQLIEYMKGLKYSSSEFQKICDELQILPLQRRLDEHMSRSLKAASDGIKNIAAGRKLSSSYNKSYDVESIFFNKKI